MHAEAQRYLGGENTESTMATLAPRYATFDALAAAVQAAGGGLLDLRGIDDPVRYNMGATVKGAEDETFTEDVFLVRKSSLDGGEGVVVEKVADVTWTASAVAVVAGSFAGHKEAKAVAVTSTGLVEARGGGAIGDIDITPALYTLPDVRPVQAIVRLGAVGTGDGGAFVIDGWSRRVE